MRAVSFLMVAMLGMSLPASAAPEDFHPGTVIQDFGMFASVPDARLGPDSVFKVAFDVSDAGPEDAVSRKLETAARFINMHADAGVKPENIHVAIVVHGGAHKDLLTSEARGSENPNAPLIAELIAHGVTIELCGQTAAYYDITEEKLLPGVTIALSAMTAHALLQQKGYTLNPF